MPRPPPVTMTVLSFSRMAPSRRGSRTHAGDELFRRPLAPLGDQTLLGRNQIGAVLHVQAVAVRPVLVHAAPRIRPVVIDLAAEQVPPDAPHVLVLADLLEILVPGEHVVDVGDLEREVIQARTLVLDAEEDVMVDV